MTFVDEQIANSLVPMTQARLVKVVASIPELLAFRVEENEVEVPDPPIQERIAAVVADVLKHLVPCTGELIEDMPEQFVEVPVLPIREQGDDGEGPSPHRAWRHAQWTWPALWPGWPAAAMVKLAKKHFEARLTSFGYGMVLRFLRARLAFVGAARPFRFHIPTVACQVVERERKEKVPTSKAQIKRTPHEDEQSGNLVKFIPVTGYEVKEFDKITSVDNDTTPIKDPDHNISDFSKTTSENTRQFGVSTVFESFVLHVSHGDFCF